jgi:hypothetical protein
MISADVESLTILKEKCSYFYQELFLQNIRLCSHNLENRLWEGDKIK